MNIKLDNRPKAEILISIARQKVSLSSFLPWLITRLPIQRLHQAHRSVRILYPGHLLRLSLLMNGTMKIPVVIVVLVAGMLVTAVPSQAAQGKRVALVIGNSKYAFAPLRNPRNDATDVASILETQLGFETELLLDADQVSMQRAIRDFSQSLKQADVRLFYYAGHGVSVKGVNYMIPVDAEIKNEDEVTWEAVDTSLVLNSMEKFNTGANVLILDACRDNPLPKSTRSNRRGLDKMEAPIGSLILYATAPGQVALDGTGRNGTFTKHLLRSLVAPDVHIGDLALDVRVAVMRDTGNQQVPWSESSLTRRVYLVGSDNPDDSSVVVAGTDIDATDVSADVSTNGGSSTAGSGISGEGMTDDSSDDTDYQSSILMAYLEAAEAGDAIAQVNLGYIYDVGRSVAEDNVTARAWYEKAAGQLQWDAVVNLGVMYLSGDGVPIDKSRAFLLFKQAAEAGHRVAQRNLGTMYQYGSAVEMNYAAARIWFEKAAEQGQTDAYVDLGDLYSRGLGIAQNDELAFEWYLKAARQGSASAQSEIGYLYDQGMGVDQDYQQAIAWFQQAADQNDPTGTYNLGEMYELGKGVAVDLNKAIQLYERAMLLGEELAVNTIIRLKAEQ